MGILELVMVAIRGLSLITNNPALGGGSSLRLQEASEFLNILADLVQAGDAGHKELVAFTETIQRMADAGTGPTKAEWAALRARSDAAHETLQAAKGEEPLMDSTKAELVEMAEDLGLEVSSSATKADIVALIEDAQE